MSEGGSGEYSVLYVPKFLEVLFGMQVRSQSGSNDKIGAETLFLRDVKTHEVVSAKLGLCLSIWWVELYYRLKILSHIYDEIMLSPFLI